MSKQSERVKRWRKLTKRKLIEAFGGKCSCCSYFRCVEAFEFHHLDSKQKDAHSGQMTANPRAWTKIVAELKKCILVCSNCHKEIHAGVREQPKDPQRLDESLIKSKTLKEQKQLIIANELAKRLSQFKQKDRYEGADLLSLYQEKKNYEAIGEMFGVTGAAIKRRIKYLQTGSYK